MTSIYGLIAKPGIPPNAPYIGYRRLIITAQVVDKIVKSGVLK